MSIYRYKFTNSDGRLIPLSNFKKTVLLIVNVASNCGFTKQYEGLQALNDKYADLGLHIIGFPCNQFGEQEPGTNEEIQEFCKTNYGVNFLISSKIDVNGENADPIYKYLVEEVKQGQDIGWNFEKFLVAKDGSVTNYQPDFTPEQLNPIIAKLLS